MKTTHLSPDHGSALPLRRRTIRPERQASQPVSDMNNTTPRTDKACREIIDMQTGLRESVVPARFARQLERELWIARNDQKKYLKRYQKTKCELRALKKP